MELWKSHYGSSMEYSYFLFRKYTALLEINNYIKNICEKQKNPLLLRIPGGRAQSRLAQEQLLAAGTLLSSTQVPTHCQLNRKPNLTFNRHQLLRPNSLFKHTQRMKVPALQAQGFHN